TAAWSAAFSSPRPISRDADSAATSVTRTASSARLRSILGASSDTLSSLIFSKTRPRLDHKEWPGAPLEILEADDAGGFEHALQLADRRHGVLHRRLHGSVRGEHDRHRFAFRPAALDHRFKRHLLVAQRRRDIGDDPRLIHHHQPDIIRALV